MLISRRVSKYNPESWFNTGRALTLFDAQLNSADETRTDHFESSICITCIKYFTSKSKL